MLTGDKSETAIQIAIQSGLLKEGFFIIWVLFLNTHQLTAKCKILFSHII
jgi:magnesium-transporting ATPase (P-type)